MAALGLGLVVGLGVGCSDDGAGAGSTDAGGVGTDWLAGWKVLVQDDTTRTNFTSVWSNGKVGAEREWVVVGGSTAEDRGRSGVVWELHGDRWTRHLLAGTGLLWWVHGDSTGRRIAVGDGGTLLRWKSGDSGIAVQAVPSLAKAGSQLFGVWWAEGGSHFYLVGGNAMASSDAGLLWRVPHAAATADLDTAAQKVQLGAGQGLLMKVWGTNAGASERVFAVGEGGNIWAEGASGWKLDGHLGEVDRFIGVSGTGPEDVVAVGGLVSGKVARRDAKGWRLAAGCKNCFINGQLAAVLLGDDGTAVVGGTLGYLAAQKEDTDKDLPLVEPPLSQLDLHGAWYDGHTAVVVGGNLGNPSVPAAAMLWRGEPLPALPALPAK